MNRHRNAALLVTAAAALLLLGACNRQDDRSVGQKVDSAVSTVEQKAGEAKTATERAADQAGQKIENVADQAGKKIESAADQAGQKIDSAASKVGDVINDATITASVNAELAKDSKLSAVRINVDTTNGRVTLAGKAPDAESRERATRLAAGVKGVTQVDNKLEIGG